MTRAKWMMVVCLMLWMGFCAGSVYANDTTEGYNVEVKTITDKDAKIVEYLASVNDDGYLCITQILQNSQNAKVNTTTFESKLLISGKIAKDTVITIKLYNAANEKEVTTYEMTVGTTETFTQPIEVKEGANTVIITYVNAKDNIDDYVTFYVNRGTTQSMEAIKTSLFIPSL